MFVKQKKRKSIHDFIWDTAIFAKVPEVDRQVTNRILMYDYEMNNKNGAFAATKEEKDNPVLRLNLYDNWLTGPQTDMNVLQYSKYYVAMVSNADNYKKGKITGDRYKINKQFYIKHLNDLSKVIPLEYSSKYSIDKAETQGWWE